MAAALIELSSFLQQPDPQTGSYLHPTLSTLIEPMIASPLVRMVALTLWLGAGWWLVRACRRPAEGRSVGKRRAAVNSHWITVGVYLLVAVLLVALELLARFGALPVPTFGALVRRALRHRSAQFGLLLAWWWIGWHFFIG